MHSPIGLDIGAVGPAEIAISIVAELVAIKRGKQAAHLRAAHGLQRLQHDGPAGERSS